MTQFFKWIHGSHFPVSSPRFEFGNVVNMMRVYGRWPLNLEGRFMQHQVSLFRLHQSPPVIFPQQTIPRILLMLILNTR